jgi:hypothetical protein
LGTITLTAIFVSRCWHIGRRNCGPGSWHPFARTPPRRTVGRGAETLQVPRDASAPGPATPRPPISPGREFHRDGSGGFAATSESGRQDLNLRPPGPPAVLEGQPSGRFPYSIGVLLVRAVRSCAQFDALVDALARPRHVRL